MLQGVQPPQSQELTAKLGSELLGTVRSIEGADTTDSSVAAVDQAISCLRTLIAVSIRQGIFQNDTKMVQSFLVVSASASAQSNSSKKRRSDENRDGGGSTSTTLPVQLIMTAILRILSFKNTVRENPDLLLLITLAADLIRAVAQHAQAGGTTRDVLGRSLVFRQAENEWLQNSAKSLLGALNQALLVLLEAITTLNSVEGLVEPREAFTSCLYACADLIYVTGTRLTRSQALLTSLESIAWDSMSCPHIPSFCVATFLAAVPMAGGLERATPPSLWSKSVQNVQGMLWKLLEKTLPTSHHMRESKEFSVSSTLQKKKDAWYETMYKIEKQETRTELVIHLVRSLVSLLICMIEHGRKRMLLLEAKVNLPELLDLIDVLLAVPLSAEASYFGTKKRLRDECDSGILSPNSVATLLANHVYMEGHRLLSTLVMDLGMTNILPYSQRLRQVGYASLLTSCSPTLRQVVEPGFVVSKKERWLPHSLVARTSAMNSLKTIIIGFGVKALSERTKTRRSSSIQEMLRIVKVVSGCLLEQIYPDERESGEWGSLEEKQNFTVACIDCLSSMLLCGGEYLSMDARQLIDSVAAACLSDTTRALRSNLFESTEVLGKVLELGKSCVCVSWPDGAASCLRHDLLRVAKSTGSRGDSLLERIATSVVSLCDALSQPTVPALYIVTRQSEDRSLAEDLVVRIEQVRQDAIIRKERQAEEDLQRKKAKMEKKQTTTQQTIGKEFSVPSESNDKVQSNKFEQTVVDTNTAPKKDPIEEKTAIPVAPPKPITKPAEKETSEQVRAALPANKNETKNEDSELDEDFPMIVDAGPDENDMEEED